MKCVTCLREHLENVMSAGPRYCEIPVPHVGGETVQVRTVYCGFCGGRIAADDVFCAHCGSRQPLAAMAASAALRVDAPNGQAGGRRDH